MMLDARLVRGLAKLAQTSVLTLAFGAAHAGTIAYGWSGDDRSGVFRVWPSHTDALMATCSSSPPPGVLVGPLYYGPTHYRQNCNTDTAGCYGDPCVIMMATSLMHKCEPNGYWAFVEFWPEPDFVLNACGPAMNPQKNTGPPRSCGVGNPIDPAWGNKFQDELDYEGFGSNPLRFGRMYNSKGSIPLAAIGNRWRSTYDRRLVLDAGSSHASVDVYRHDGRTLNFSFKANGIPVPLTTSDPSARWVPDADISDVLTRGADAHGNTTGWTYQVADSEETETYDSAGTLVLISSRAGVMQSLAYDAQGRLASVTDPFGRALAFTYDARNRIAQMRDPAGGSYQYAYDAMGNLTGVTYPDGTERVYWYNEPAHTGGANFPAALTGITDESGQRFATFTYEGTTGNAVASEHAGVERYSVSNYTMAASVVTDPLGTQRTHNFTNVHGVLKCTGVSQPCANCGSNNASAITYDANGNVASRTDFNGNKTCYAYDLARNLETTRVEGLLAGESCATAVASPPDRPDVRMIATVWHWLLRRPTTVTEPAPGGRRTTTLVYDAMGNRIAKTITGSANDGSGGTVSRTWTWSYRSLGRVETATDPNGNVTRYEYFADDDAMVNGRGNLKTVANALEHVTRFADYDAHGRPSTIIDPNGVVTTLSYSPRGWLVTRTMGGELSRYDYYDNGLLRRSTLPDGSTLEYEYNAARQLTRVTDGLGNSIAYTLDAMGNRIREDVYDRQGELARTRGRVFDTLGRLAADLDAAGAATVYSYDDNGNLRTVTDPVGHQTLRGYDALNRLLSVSDPAGAVTRYGYDGSGIPQQVTDARGLATLYNHNGIGDLVAQASPDTGVMTRSFDAAGNVLGSVDARGVAVAYATDALNRVKQVVYSKPGLQSETHVFEYDDGASGSMGRLSRITDPVATTQWTYDPRGRVLAKVQTIDGLAQTVAYRYNGAGQIESMTTPSGQLLGFSYVNNRLAGITVNGSVLIADAVTAPFGPIAAWQWGNLLYTFRDYDADGQLWSWEFRNGATVLRNDLTWDHGRLVRIEDPLHPALQANYGYDELGRLTSAERGNPVASFQQFAYDAAGNRSAVNVDGGVSSWVYDRASNQLISVTGDMRVDPLHGDVQRTYRYNLANRLAEVRNGFASLATYGVNALGQRIVKTANGLVTRFFYDERGRLLGEYDVNGNLIQETVWLEELPVATLRPRSGSTGNPAQVDIYYVHVDHLGTPRAVTRPSDDRIVWRWDDLDPFGANRATENPSGAGAFQYDLRFPGQYYDAETGTHYNYYRDYLPSGGRYLQSDRLGLRGGLNTYNYGDQSPGFVKDRFGLTTYVCRQPLQSCGKPMRQRCFIDVPGNPFYHQYLCVIHADGNMTCGGQDRSGNPFGSPGKPSNDSYPYNRPDLCNGRDDRPCVDLCVERRISDPNRPWYGIPFGADCQEWSEEVLSECRAECSRR